MGTKAGNIIEEYTVEKKKENKYGFFDYPRLINSSIKAQTCILLFRVK